MSKFVVAEPGDGVGGGLFQGIGMGLVFCYSGKGSDLPLSEITFFSTQDEAEKCRSWLIGEATSSGSESLNILQQMEVVELTIHTDIEALAKEWHQKESYARPGRKVRHRKQSVS